MSRARSLRARRPPSARRRGRGRPRRARPAADRDGLRRREGLTYAGSRPGRRECRPLGGRPGGPRLSSGESGATSPPGRAFLRDLIAWHEHVRLPATTPSGPSWPSPTAPSTGSSSASRPGSPVREFRRRFTQDQANLTVLRFEDGAARPMPGSGRSTTSATSAAGQASVGMNASADAGWSPACAGSTATAGSCSRPGPCGCSPTAPSPSCSSCTSPRSGSTRQRSGSS